VKFVIGVTGTPGVGKSHFSAELGRRINADIIELNDMVKAQRLYSGKDKEGSLIVRISALDKALGRTLNSSRGNVIVAGHLIPELDIKFDIIIVLRYRPEKLLARLEERHYSKNKIKENIIAEALDYCGTALNTKACSEIYEIDSGSKAQTEHMIQYIVKRAKGVKANKPRSISINNMQDIEKIAMSGKYNI